jgi:hypothetical protein
MRLVSQRYFRDSESDSQTDSDEQMRDLTVACAPALTE